MKLGKCEICQEACAEGDHGFLCVAHERAYKIELAEILKSENKKKRRPIETPRTQHRDPSNLTHR